jgi:LSD1 subclass zinc finger protein
VGSPRLLPARSVGTTTSRFAGPRRPGGSRSPASRLRCATCHTNGLASAESRSRRERPPGMNRANAV